MGSMTLTEVLEQTWKIVSKHISRENQPLVANRLAELFEKHGCDSVQETPLWDLITLKCYCFGEDGESVQDCLRCSGEGFIRKSFT